MFVRFAAVDYLLEGYSNLFYVPSDVYKLAQEHIDVALIHLNTKIGFEIGIPNLDFWLLQAWKEEYNTFKADVFYQKVAATVYMFQRLCTSLSESVLMWR